MADGDPLGLLSSLSQPSASSKPAVSSDLRSDEGIFSPKSEPDERRRPNSQRAQTSLDQAGRGAVLLPGHGRSSWNEFLGAHKRAQWEEQDTVSHHTGSDQVRGQRNSGQELKRQTAKGGGVRNVFRLGKDTCVEGGEMWESYGRSWKVKVAVLIPALRGWKPFKQNSGLTMVREHEKELATQRGLDADLVVQL
eukprot:Skav204866  [mRNA]  locus=scaffold1679:33813:49591:- [translate_table: standard]